MIKIRKNINVSSVPVPICDPCWDGFHTACEGGNCNCVWTHYGPGWEHNKPAKEYSEFKEETDK